MAWICIWGQAGISFILKKAVGRYATLRHARSAGCSGRTDTSPIGWVLQKPFVLSLSKHGRCFITATAVFRFINLRSLSLKSKWNYVPPIGRFFHVDTTFISSLGSYPFSIIWFSHCASSHQISTRVFIDSVWPRDLRVEPVRSQFNKRISTVYPRAWFLRILSGLLLWFCTQIPEVRRIVSLRQWVLLPYNCFPASGFIFTPTWVVRVLPFWDIFSLDRRERHE